jgi:hypothetical protein
MTTFRYDGIDDGPALPRWVVNAWKRERVVEAWMAGATLRDVAAKHEISHETARAWTETLTRPKGASRRPRGHDD